jgi:uracil-DNA glycosylase family 4
MRLESEFDQLCAAVAACQLCPRMAGSLRVLNRGCGPLTAEIMVVGEAPGRLGADQSALPFHGDKAGTNFEDLLAFVGLSRSEIFVTNALLCNPKDTNGNNATPNSVELRNCSQYLQRQIDLVNPKIVATLGAVALRACDGIEAHAGVLADAVRTSIDWYGRELIPLYHPGQRAMLHRSMANQRSDYQYLAERARAKCRKGRSFSPARVEVAQLVCRMLAQLGELSYFALHKLLYLIEYHHWLDCREAATGAYFVRQKDGPYCVELHLARLRGLPLAIRGSQSSIRIVYATGGLFAQMAALPESIELAMSTVLAKYGRLTDAELKTAVYMSTPMRRMLKREKLGNNLYNAPILFDEHPREASSTRIGETPQGGIFDHLTQPASERAPKQPNERTGDFALVPQNSFPE